jgi:hypothetical protein
MSISFARVRLHCGFSNSKDRDNPVKTQELWANLRKEQVMAQYMLLLRGGEFRHYSPEEMQKILEHYLGWAEQLRKEGRHRGGEELKDGGRVLSVKNGKVVDGPFTETKEVVGGYFLFEAKDYDEAAAISKGCPHLTYGGWLEIREINPH